MNATANQEALPSSVPLRAVLYVAALDPGIRFGSLEEQVLILARSFRDRGATFLPVFVAPLRGRTRVAYMAAGVDAESLDLHRFRLATLRRLVRLIDEHGIEIVHWNFYHPLNAYVWALSVVRPHLTHYLTEHTSRSADAPPRRSRLRRALKRALLTRYRSIVCVSDFVADDLRSQGLAGRLTVHTHFINTDRFRPDPTTRQQIRRELDAESLFVLLLVAHLIPEKGGEVLLRALAELPPQTEAWIVGDGPDAGRLHELSENLGLAKRVRFLGNQSEVQPYMQAADCLVCPSLWLEAAGLVNIEALACGIPVIASRVGGIPEIVHHGCTGILVEPGRSDKLAAAVRRLLEEPERIAVMNCAARRAAVEHHSVERRLPEYLDLHRLCPPEAP